MSDPALDGGEAVLQAARDLGVDYIFSSAGSEWAPVWEALSRQEAARGAGPRYLDLTHETLAVAMATGYGCVTGRGQLVLLHAAAGLLQGANAIHGALLTGAPMVVCSGESTGYGDAAGADPGSQWYRNLSVVGGPQAIAAPFTKWSNAAADVSVLYGMLKRAGELAAQAPAGPVYVNTPVEVLLAPWRPAATSPVPVAVGGSTVAVPEDVELAVRLLSAARRPVLAVETAGRDPAAFAALVELADLLALPVVEPQSAVSSSFPRGNPMHAGGDLAALAVDADLVVLLGCRSPWYPPSAKPGNATVLVIDEVPHRPHMAYQVLTADHYVGGAIAPTLRAITARLRQWGLDEAAVEARRAARSAAHAADQEKRSSPPSRRRSRVREGPVDPVAVAATLRELIADDAVVVDETITHSRVIARHLMAGTAGRYSYVQGGLGQGLGVALGAKLGLGDRLIGPDGRGRHLAVQPGPAGADGRRAVRPAAARGGLQQQEVPVHAVQPDPGLPGRRVRHEQERLRRGPVRPARRGGRGRGRRCRGLHGDHHAGAGADAGEGDRHGAGRPDRCRQRIPDPLTMHPAQRRTPAEQRSR